MALGIPVPGWWACRLPLHGRAEGWRRRAEQRKPSFGPSRWTA